MLAQTHNKIRELLQNQGIVFCYSGYMTESILSGIGKAIRQKMELEDTDTKTVRGVFSIFVEQMQNVIRYSAEREPESAPESSVLSYGLLTVGREDHNYFVTCGNKIQQRDVARLNDQLTTIQKMDREQLKTLYKQILKGDVPEGSKGAGVGFVDIAKKATRPIEFDFLPLSEKHAYFSLKAYI
ncbi:MAG: hypothetical protein HQL67_03755 [Magnetococcales bacterium]|nr:hypothetical protein [Magnetococcales bacterium]